ncbi:hypothetical protein GCM10029964_043200 [Kibdelosporangium lantanae]
MRLLTATVAFAAAVTFAAVPIGVAQAASDPAQYVNPFVGTRPGGPDFGHGVAPG